MSKPRETCAYCKGQEKYVSVFDPMCDCCPEPKVETEVSPREFQVLVEARMVINAAKELEGNRAGYFAFIVKAENVREVTHSSDSEFPGTVTIACQHLADLETTIARLEQRLRLAVIALEACADESHGEGCILHHYTKGKCDCGVSVAKHALAAIGPLDGDSK